MIKHRLFVKGENAYTLLISHSHPNILIPVKVVIKDVKYDEVNPEYLVKIIKFYDSEHEHTLYEENLDVIRPYTDPSKLGTTASEIQEYTTLEMVARSIIDTAIVDGFYNNDTVGLTSKIYLVK